MIQEAEGLDVVSRLYALALLPSTPFRTSAKIPRLDYGSGRTAEAFGRPVASRDSGIRLAQNRNYELKAGSFCPAVTVGNVGLFNRISGIFDGTGEVPRSESCKV